MSAWNLGQPARDHIVAADEAHRERMEKGSTALRYAIEDYFVARAQRRLQRVSA